jgi:hypothetical protein
LDFFYRIKAGLMALILNDQKEYKANKKETLF